MGSGDIANLILAHLISTHLGTLADMRFRALLLLLAGVTCFAQTNEEKAVIGKVQQLFDAMAKSDTAAARAIVIPEGRVIATRANGAVSNMSQEEFAIRLGAGERTRLERMWNPTVQVRANLAQVWTEYDFHLDGKFTHCGVDVFTLVKVNGEWKVAGIGYTIETEGCKPSPLGPPPAK
jgi:hypothetical protein